MVIGSGLRRPLVRTVGNAPDVPESVWVVHGDVAHRRVSAPADAGLGWVDLLLICLFLAGLYTNYTIMLSAKVPLPSAPAGFAGMILLVRRRNDITPRALIGFCAIFTLYLGSMLCAPDISWLSRRTNGLELLEEEDAIARFDAGA